jgi:colanic acid/amylovoran biosynthesis glycosyltransferase
MTTGRLVEKKGIRYAVEAAARLKRDGVDLQYDIVGEGPERLMLESLAQSLGLGTSIIFHGAKAHDVIQPMLANAHLFIAPSVTASDSNADAPINTLKEAMATGVPVVSTVSGGIPELVDDGESGFLAPERDANGLYRRILDALDAPTSWPVIAERAKATVNNRFDLSRTTDSLIRIYEKALAS